MAPKHHTHFSIQNGSELPNAGVTSPFRHIHVPYEGFCTHKVHSYNNLWKSAKQHFWIFYLLLSSVELAYCQSGTSTLDGFYTKRLLSVVCVILDQQNLCNFTRNSLFVGSYFLNVHAHFTFHRKVRLKRMGLWE